MASPPPEQRLYTLTEARQILALEECRLDGCDLYRVVSSTTVETLGILMCRRCGTGWYPRRPGEPL